MKGELIREMQKLISDLEQSRARFDGMVRGLFAFDAQRTIKLGERVAIASPDELRKADDQFLKVVIMAADVTLRESIHRALAELVENIEEEHDG